MYTKLTSLNQVKLLRKGDLIKRFPYNDKDDRPKDQFDDSNPGNIASYEVRSISEDGVFSLIESRSRTLSFASPVDVGRLFIKGSDLISEKVWWI